MLLGHLNTLSAQSKGFEDYSLQSILTTFPTFTKQQVLDALDELEGEGTIEIRRLEFDVFLPTGDRRGKELTKTLAKHGVLTYSPFAGIALILGITFVLVAFFLPPVSPSQTVTDVADAYTKGIALGILASIFLGVIGGSVVQRLLIRYRTNRIVYEETYESAIRYTKYIGSLFTMMTVGYLVWANISGNVVQAEVIFTILGAAVAIVVGYEQAMLKTQQRKNE